MTAKPPDTCLYASTHHARNSVSSSGTCLEILSAANLCMRSSGMTNYLVFRFRQGHFGVSRHVRTRHAYDEAAQTFASVCRRHRLMFREAVSVQDRCRPRLPLRRLGLGLGYLSVFVANRSSAGATHTAGMDALHHQSRLDDLLSRSVGTACRGASKAPRPR
jgi:hypothetical protein